MLYDLESAKQVMIAVSEKAKQHLELLAELDGLSGDGDLGETIGKIAGVLSEQAKNETTKEFGEMMMKTALAMNKAAPSTLGTLLSGSVMALAKEMKGKTMLTAQEVSEIPEIMAKSIREKGKANLGDKTILDALLPMAEAICEEFKKSGNLQVAYAAGAEAARKGAESTRGMIPKAGRAQWIGERVKEHLDGGAMLCAKLAELFQ